MFNNFFYKIAFEFQFPNCQSNGIDIISRNECANEILFSHFALFNLKVFR